MTVTEPEPMSRTAAIAYAIGLPLALLALVFGPVGRLDWLPGWVFVAFVVVAFAASALVLWHTNPAIYRARSRFQPGTKRWDMILLWLMLPAMVAEVPLATPCDFSPAFPNQQVRLGKPASQSEARDASWRPGRASPARPPSYGARPQSAWYVP